MRRRLAAVAVGSALVLGVPSATLAVSLLQDDMALERVGAIAGFTPAAPDPGVARIVAERSGGPAQFMQFTPAGSDFKNRSVTVAVRVNQEAAKAISVRSAIDATSRARVSDSASLRIAPTRYNLGLARGYQSFAKPTAAPAISEPLSRADIPDLADFKPTPGVKQEPSRFAARVQMEPGDAAGRTSRVTRSGDDTIVDQTLDVAGSYRLTRNLDVTAGVRYSQDSDALARLPDIEEQDSQAVYIGTQFRF